MPKNTAGQREELVQTLAMSSPKELGYELPGEGFVRSLARYADPQVLAAAEREQQQAYSDLFQIRRVHTDDVCFNDYVNAWLPLQMLWTASLDRGWPTGMRGARDCANDFMGQVYLNHQWARQVLLLVLECQRTDGWIPRQVSNVGRKGKHDLREYVDGGAFMLEFLHEYLSVTGDRDVLNERVKWLDSDQDATVLEHSVRMLEYYLNPDNIGQHGLCKIRGGDWLDPVNRAGLMGTGESVMVTCQVVMGITYLLDVLSWAGQPHPQAEQWQTARERFAQSVRQHAYNEGGFFSGMFTDKGQWIFSHSDPDGACRPYACVNAYAVISGIADDRQRQGVWNAYQQLRDGEGYRLFYPPLGNAPIELLGRLGSGDSFQGQFENGASYNHGSSGFLGRSLAVMGKAEEFYRTLQFMLPYNAQIHKPEDTITAPYAIVNCYQQIPLFKNRGGMAFLTGSVAMALRMVYNWLFGLKFTLNELVLDPCIPSELGDTQVTFEARGKQVHLTYKATGRSACTVNGAEWSQKTALKAEGRNCFAIPYESLKDTNEVQVEY